MKRLVSLLLILALGLCALTACGTYKPVKSTDTEAKTAVTFTYGGKKTEVAFELFRAFLLNYRGEVTGESALEKKILTAVADVYAPILLAESVGYDPYGKDADADVEDYIKISVEGGTLFGDTVEGYDSYEAYLENLKALNLNYSVQDLLFRASLSYDAVDLYFEGTQDDDIVGDKIVIGAINPTEQQLWNYYNDENTARVIWARLSADAFDAAQVETFRQTAAGKSGESAVTLYLINLSVDGASEIEAGHVLTKDSLDSRYYGELSALALETPLGEVAARAVEITGTAADGYYILYRAAKSQDHFNAHLDEIKHSYIQNEIGKRIAAIKNELLETAAVAPWVKALDYAAVTMDNPK